MWDAALAEAAGTWHGNLAAPPQASPLALCRHVASSECLGLQPVPCFQSRRRTSIIKFQAGAPANLQASWPYGTAGSQGERTSRSSGPSRPCKLPGEVFLRYSNAVKPCGSAITLLLSGMVLWWAQTWCNRCLRRLHEQACTSCVGG